MIAYRIADARHPVFDSTGATLHGGRWNSPGVRAIYAAETYSGALLEVLVHANLSQPPKNHRSVRIEIPADLGMETVEPDALNGWDAEDAIVSRAYGDEWSRSRRTVILRVPSVITHGREHNLVFNPDHPKFSDIRAGIPEIVLWDKRLFGR